LKNFILVIFFVVLNISFVFSGSIFVSNSNLGNFGNCAVSYAANPARYKVWGTGLTNPLIISASNHFEISLSVNQQFSKSITLSPISGSVDTTEIFVRFIPSVSGVITGTILNSSTGSSSLSVSVRGTGVSSVSIPANYYSGLNQTGSALLTALYNKILGHTNISYNALWNTYINTDMYYDGTLWDVYSTNINGKETPYTFVVPGNQCGVYHVEGDCYNREHSFPQSWFASLSPMVSDMHFIYPTDGYVNGIRSDNPYGEVSSPTYTAQNGGKRGPSVSPGYVSTVFEPVDEYKGDLARAQLYIATRYNNLIAGWVNNGSANDILAGNAYPAYDAWFLNLLIKWHNQDPPSVKEINRNNAVYAVQGNRNPFIDSPQYVNRIWGLSKPTEPTIISSAIIIDSIASTGMKLSWKSGNGNRRLLVMKQGSSVNQFPTDSALYTASSIFGTGSNLGSGNYVVYDGMGSSAIISGLTSGLNYHFALFEYNGLSKTSNFLTSSYATYSHVSNKIDTLITCGDSTLLTADSGYSSYLWRYQNKTSRTIKVGSSGWYAYSAINGSNSLNDSIYLVLLNAKITKDDTAACNHEYLNFSINSSLGVSVLWSNGSVNANTTFSMNPALLSVPDNGDDPDDIRVITYPYRKKFWVRLSYLGNTCSDTAYVTIYEPPVLSLVDTVFAVGKDSILLSGPANFTNYVWSNGVNSRNNWLKNSGVYSLNVYESVACSASDTCRLILFNGFNSDSLKVCGDSVQLSADIGANSYLWNTNSTARQIQAKTSGWYFCTYTLGSYQARDSIYVSIHSIRSSTITASTSTIICAGSSVNLQTSLSPSYTYFWQLNGSNISGQNSNSISANSTGFYRLISVNSNACADTSNALFVQMNSPFLTVTPKNNTYVFTGKLSSGLNDLNNWIIYQTASNSYLPASNLPNQYSSIVLPALGSCALNEVQLQDSFVVGNLTIDNNANLALNNHQLRVIGVLNGDGRIKGNGSIIFSDTGSFASIRMHNNFDTLSNITFNRNSRFLDILDTLKIDGFVNPLAGQINSNNYLVLLSTNVKTAGILKGVVTGNVTVQRFIPGSSGRRYRYLSAPFSSGPSIASSWQQKIHITGVGTAGSICPNLMANSNGFDATLLNSPSFFTFNETTAINTNTGGTTGGTVYQNAWTSIPNTTSTLLNSGKGYRVFIRGNRNQGCDLLNGNNPVPQDVVLSASGNIQNGTFIFPITYSPLNGGGWNLVGNPYPCAIDWNANSAWQRTNVDNHVWIYRPAGNHFATFNGALNVGVNFGSNIIESGSAFFVKANAANPVLQVNEDAKISLQSTPRLFKKSTKSLRMFLIKPGEVMDENLFSMLDGSSDSMDIFDSEKMLNPSLNIFSLLNDSTSLSINSFPIVYSEKSINLDFQSSFSGNHILSFKQIEDFSDYDVLLVDNYLGVIQLINDKSNYEFIYQAAVPTKSRFNLIFVYRASVDYFKAKEKIESRFKDDLHIIPNPVFSSFKVEFSS
jgi:endonuclease I